jgi:hypothetical protein
LSGGLDRGDRVEIVEGNCGFGATDLGTSHLPIDNAATRESGFAARYFYLEMLFDLEGLNVVAVKSKSTDSLSEQLAQELANDGRLNRRLQQVLIDPFRYKSNSLGVEADRFLRGYGQPIQVESEILGLPKILLS